MSHWMRTCAIFLALAYLAPAHAAEVPFLSGRVVDNAEILQPATRSALVIAIKAHEQHTSDQIVVLTVPTIGGESVEEYASKVFETWKLGVKGKDNGVLVVIVPQDRKMRIEVGYGLEGTLTDVASSRIIRNVMTPLFKAGNYDQGVLDGVRAVIAELEGQADVAPDAAAHRGSSVPKTDPRSPSPAADSTASHSACAATSPSEWPEHPSTPTGCAARQCPRPDPPPSPIAQAEGSR